MAQADVLTPAREVPIPSRDIPEHWLMPVRSYYGVGCRGRRRVGFSKRAPP